MDKKEGTLFLIVLWLLIIIPLSFAYIGNSSSYDVVVSDLSCLGYEETSQPDISLHFEMKNLPELIGNSSSYTLFPGLARMLGPIAFDISMTPSPAISTSLVNCSGIDAFTTTIDNATKYYRFNDTSGTISTSWSTSSTLNCSSAGCIIGESLMCYYKVDDGIMNSSAIFEAIEVVNNDLSVVNEVNISPGSAYTNSSLRCFVNVTDAENDNVTVFVEWLRDNKISNWTSYMNTTFVVNDSNRGVDVFSNINISTNLTFHDESWLCRVRVRDQYGRWTNYSNVTRIISNYTTSLSIENGTASPVTGQNVFFYANYSSVLMPVSGVGLKDFEIGGVVWNSSDLDLQNNTLSVEFFDFDGDGRRNEVLLGVRDFPPFGIPGIILAAIYSNGTLMASPDWSMDDQAYSISVIKTQDIDNDSVDEIFIGVSGNDVFVYNISGGVINNKDMGAGYSSATRDFVVYDVDHDGYLDDVAISTYSEFHVFNTSDFLNWTGFWNVTNSTYGYELVLGDFDNDSYVDDVARIGVGSAGRESDVRNDSGGVIWNFSNAAGDFYSGAAIDYDHDGYMLEIVYGGDGELFIYGFNGTVGAEYSSVDYLAYSSVVSGIVAELEVMDADGDGWEDDIISAGEDGVIRAFNESLDQIWNFSTNTGGYITNIILSDVDGDGSIDIIGGGANGTVWILNKSGSMILKYDINEGYIGSTSWGTSKGASIDISDVNNDGIDDIAVASSNGFAHILQSVTCSASFNDSSSYNMTWNNTLRKWQMNKTFSVNGTYEYNVTCSKGGYETRYDSSMITVLPNYAPIINYNNLTPLLAFTNTTLNCSANATDIEGDPITLYYQFIDQDGMLQNWNTITTFDCDAVSGCDKHDNISCQLIAFDGFTNSSINSSNIVEIQNTPPILSSITSNISYVSYNNPISITTVGAYDEDNENLALECGNVSMSGNLCLSSFQSPEVSCSFNSPWNDTQNHTIYCHLWDLGYDNTSNEVNITIFSDNSPPNITLISPLDNSSTNLSAYVTFIYNVTDNLNITSCEIIINGTIEATDNNITKNTNQTFTVMIDRGNYSWSVNCTDDAGNEGSSLEWNLTQLHLCGDMWLTNIGATGFEDTNPIYTYSRTVIINILLVPTAHTCRYRNQGYGWTGWEYCNSFIHWVLPDGDGNWIVEVEINHTGIDLGVVSNFSDWIILEGTGEHLDMTPPENFKVYDYSNYTNDETCLEAKWDVAVDTETGIIKQEINYSYQIIDTNSSIIKNWTNTGTVREITCPLIPAPLEPEPDMVLLMHFDNDSSVGENGTFVYDWSDNGNKGVCSGISCPSFISNSRLYGAYYFDGDNKNFDLGNPSQLSLNRNFTISAWIKKGSNPSSQQAIISGGVDEWYLRSNNAINDNKLELLESQVALVLQGNTVLQIDTWYHVAVTVGSGSTAIITLYVNGQIDGNKTSSVTFNDGTNNTFIGANDFGIGSSEHFNGTIDEVAIWNRTLTAEEIRSIYLDGIGSLGLSENHKYIINVSATNPAELTTYSSSDGITVDLTSPLMSWVNSSHNSSWSNNDSVYYSWEADDLLSGIDGYSIFLDENPTTQPDEIPEKDIPVPGEISADKDMVLLMHFNNDSSVGESNTLAYDWSGNGNNGTISGADISNYSKFGKSINFSSSGTDGVAISDTDNLGLTDQLTVMAWIHPTAFSTFGSIVTKKWFGNWDPWHVFTLRFSATPVIQFSVTTEGTDDPYETGSKVIPSYQWTHVAGVYNGTHISLYVNGVMDTAPTARTGTLNITDRPVYIGRNEHDNSYDFEGLIDEVAIWNRGLTADEIYSIYEKGLPSRWTYTNKSEGQYYFHVRPRDRAGNWGSEMHYGPVRIDTTPPTRPAPNNPTMYGTGGDIKFSWAKSTDTLSLLDYYTISIINLTDNSTFSANTSNTTYGLPSSLGSNYYAIITAYDNAGNSINSTEPEKTELNILSARPNGVTIADNPIIKVVTDLTARCKQDYNDEDFLYTDSTYHETKLVQPDGVQNLKITCVDNNRYQKNTTISYTIDTATPISNVSIISADDTYVGENAEVIIDVDPDRGAISKARFKLFLNGINRDEFTVIDNDDQGNYSIIFKADIAGVYNITINVDTASGNYSAIDITEISLTTKIIGVGNPINFTKMTYSDINTKKGGLASDSETVVITSGGSDLKIESAKDGKTYIFLTRPEFNARRKNTELEKNSFLDYTNSFGYPRDDDFIINNRIEYENLEIEGIDLIQAGTHSLFIRNLGIGNNNKTVLRIEKE